MTLYRDEDMGDVVVDSPKKSILPEYHQSISDKFKLISSMSNNVLGYESNNRKLAAFIGPISLKNVNII